MQRIGYKKTKKDIELRLAKCPEHALKGTQERFKVDPLKAFDIWNHFLGMNETMGEAPPEPTKPSTIIFHAKTWEVINMKMGHWEQYYNGRMIPIGDDIYLICKTDYSTPVHKIWVEKI